MKRRYMIFVTGRVQNVGFRFSACERAKELRLSGFVRNKDDGSVYIEVEGEESKCNDFLTWCWSGPGAAKVSHVHFGQTCELKNYQQFAVL